MGPKNRVVTSALSHGGQEAQQGNTARIRHLLQGHTSMCHTATSGVHFNLQLASKTIKLTVNITCYGGGDLQIIRLGGYLRAHLMAVNGV